MFYKGKIPLFSEKCGFHPPPIFIGKVYFGFLWALLICLFIILCIELKEISAWCFAGLIRQSTRQKSNTTTEVASIVLLSIQLPA